MKLLPFEDAVSNDSFLRTQCPSILSSPLFLNHFFGFLNYIYVHLERFFKKTYTFDYDTKQGPFSSSTYGASTTEYDIYPLLDKFQSFRFLNKEDIVSQAITKGVLLYHPLVVDQKDRLLLLIIIKLSPKTACT